jgi:putative glutamine amidotransferase
MSKRPLIGVTGYETQHIEAPHLPIFALGRRYAQAVAAAGGAPLVVPPGLDDDALAAIFARLDGVLLSGGGDVDPACYGEAPHPALVEVSTARDRMEMALARRSVEGSKPLLAICRGIQVLNVALGGSLLQDIPTQHPGALTHTFDVKSTPRAHLAHSVRIDAATRLQSVMGVNETEVNSWHHQALKQVAQGLSVTAHSPDGIVEAVEIAGHRFAIGVQWHPEWLYDRQPEMMRLFEALVHSASA